MKLPCLCYVVQVSVALKVKSHGAQGTHVHALYFMQRVLLQQVALFHKHERQNFEFL